MYFELAPGEVELERGEAFNYRGTFDQDDGQYIFTNGRLVHVTNPWYLSPRGRAALIYFICTLFGYKPVHITQQIPLAHIASLQFMSYMFTTGYRIRSI